MPKVELKFSNKNLFPHYSGITNLGRLDAGLIQLKIARIIATLRPEAERFQEAEAALLEEYALKDGQGNPVPGVNGFGVQVDPLRRKEFLQKREEMYEAEITLNIECITEAELEQIAKKTGMDPANLSYLFPFVSEG